jgi:membrane protein DedA with SNARE-associated domain
MLGLLNRHSFAAICIAVFLEELGIPMPIPTDLLIIFAGVAAGPAWPRLVMAYAAISFASALGSSILYAIIRRGGRPLVARFGPYVHLGPHQLARAERFLTNTGWTGIAVGRAIPGVRLGTVIMCGLLNVPYRRYLTAHLVGSSVYVIIFLGLGALFGPRVAAYLHLPEAALRLLWTGALALGLPSLAVWLAAGRRTPRPAPGTPWQRAGALLLASFAGTAALASTWAFAATIIEAMGFTAPLNLTYALAGWLLGRAVQASSAYMLIYTLLLGLCISLGAIYDLVVIPHLAPGGTSRIRAALGLTLLGVVLLTSILTPALIAAPASPIVRWWTTGGPQLGVVLLLGLLSYACTTVYGRVLALTAIPNRQRTSSPLT